MVAAVLGETKLLWRPVMWLVVVAVFVAQAVAEENIAKERDVIEQAVPKEVKTLDGLDLGAWVRVVVEKDVNLEDYNAETLFEREGSGVTTVSTPPLIRLPGAYGIAVAGLLMPFLCVLCVVMFRVCQNRRKRRSYAFTDIEVKELILEFPAFPEASNSHSSNKPLTTIVESKEETDEVIDLLPSVETTTFKTSDNVVDSENTLKEKTGGRESNEKEIAPLSKEESSNQEPSAVPIQEPSSAAKTSGSHLKEESNTASEVPADTDISGISTTTFISNPTSTTITITPVTPSITTIAEGATPAVIISPPDPSGPTVSSEQEQKVTSISPTPSPNETGTAVRSGEQPSKPLSEDVAALLVSLLDSTEEEQTQL